eukprot:CAMPEP_0178385236 /NCGR_PEP_ID=MMETSP0689_2-20121128/7930_1 /TAXON_ID=160604 /ORGANISM="Amphidinium massartii, Strain CS-259" /LENGTH=774 /DNA_ID=CAMNT_0020005515 /DNA_START=56 /DNA_END=2381 /DNA_ORIENTATION=-
MSTAVDDLVPMEFEAFGDPTEAKVTCRPQLPVLSSSDAVGRTQGTASESTAPTVAGNGRRTPMKSGSSLTHEGRSVQLADPAPSSMQEREVSGQRDQSTEASAERMSMREDTMMPNQPGNPSGSLCFAIQAFGTNHKLPDATPEEFGGKTSELTHFDQDLREWVFEVSERFHVRVFLIELLGQTLYAFFGPFSLPILWMLYGGRPGLQNRGFWFRRELAVVWVMQLVFFAGIFCGGAIWICLRPKEIFSAEVKFILMNVVMRIITIALKYAYMSRQSWDQLNTSLADVEYLFSLLIVAGWSHVAHAQLMKYAEMSFIGVIGSRYQRDSLYLKFIAWPTTREALTQLRHRLDCTSKSLYHIPTGKVLMSSGPMRKAERLVNMLEEESPRISNTKSSGYMPCMAEKLLGVGDGAMKGDLRRNEPMPTAMMDRTATQTTMEKCTETIFRAGLEGRIVPLTDLFVYIVQGVLRSEEAMLLREKPLVRIIAFSTVLLPSVLRFATWGSPFGGSSWTAAAVVGTWPVALVCFFSNLDFIAVAAKDMWRRRALMRSCAALLTFQRHYRMNCPAEVDILPVIDLCDPHTIEAWRKLRQLCKDWGRYFFLRIQAFTTAFVACTLVITADLVAAVTIPWYTDLTGFNVVHLILSLTPAAALFICIMMQVHLGQEVNGAADRHIFLLRRQRVVMTSAKQRSAADFAARGDAPPPQNEALTRAIDFIDVLCDDIEAEHAADPVKLIGLYCGYSLISVLYFIPVTVLSTLFRFCTDEETRDRCLTLG